jgi:internalin A
MTNLSLEYIQKLIGIKLKKQNSIDSVWSFRGSYKSDNDGNILALNLDRFGIENVEFLKDLECLVCLRLHGNSISDIGVLRSLKKLTKLDLRANAIKNISPINELVKLTYLDLSDNRIDTVPSLVTFNELKTLKLQENEINSIDFLKGLSNLELVYLGDNKITDLHPWILDLGLPVKVKIDDFKKGIYLHNNPLKSPPAEVAQQGNAAILNYFREQETQGVDYLYEAKLLIIGEGGAGKTSLLRRLYQPDKPMPEEQDSTKGIDIYRHDFSLKNGRTFRLNVWDFGGQEIYHATHQFFLTKRSLYILLDDTRKDYKSVHDEGFKYWLEVVDLLGGHSPVLVFQNEKSGRSKIIDQSGIKGRFDNVKDFYRGNLQQADEADSLREAIEFYAQQLPHIGEALPAKWVVIREQIEALAGNKPFISLREYFDIYSQYLEFDRAKALYLSEYLHDLGVFLHFQDDRLLVRTVILQNQWATEAVFKILDDEAIKDKLGHFDAADCLRLWRDSVYADMHPELLALMQKFELCYRLPDMSAETWLAPQLLSPSKPADLPFNNEPGDLILRYHYPFLPKGLVSRLIVRMHRFVQRPEWSWSSGVLFEQGETTLLAEIPALGSEITLRARGPERKELLSVIAADLDALNATFHGLPDKVDKLVPCNCEHCIKSDMPAFFEVQELLQRKKDGQIMAECPGRGCYEKVNVLEVLDGITFAHMPGWAEDKEKQGLANLQPENSERTIKIFLASSLELKEDRDAFDLYFRQQNDLLKKQGIYLQIIRWENFLDAMSDTRLQNEYNQAVKDCDIFVSLFFTKTGKFTEEEFDTAHKQFKGTGKPLIYTFFKDTCGAKPTRENRKDFESLFDFQDKLSELGHFHTEYKDIEHLKRQFKDQLEKLYPTFQ